MTSYKNPWRPPNSHSAQPTVEVEGPNMKLFYVLFAVLALALAEEDIADSEAQATVELLKIPRESLETAASAYNYNQNRLPQQDRWTNIESSKFTNAPPQNSYVPPQNSYVPPQNNYIPPLNNYIPPLNNYIPPQNTYVPPQNTYVPPQNNYVPPQNDYVPPQNTVAPPQQGYYPPQTWTTPAYTWTTSTQSPVIKNELIYGDNGSYKYEYQLVDGTHVGEHGYYTDPRGTEESLVKTGWYSYPGADGKIYTVQYYADHTGYHPYGAHLPTARPIPASVKTAIDQQEKEQAQPEAVKDKPIYYPNEPTYYPNEPTYYPNQPAYKPNEQIYYPNPQQ